MAYTARTPEQYFVFQHLADKEDRDCASVHDIACDVFTGTDGDQERVTSVLYQLKSWRLVEETVAGFRLREGAVLLRPARLPRLASKPSAPVKKPTAKKPAAKAVPRKPSVAKPSAAAAKPTESFQDKCRTIGERALRRLPALPAGQGLYLIPGYPKALAPEMVWTRPQTSPLLRVGDRVQPLLDACEGRVTVVASRVVRVNLGQDYGFETLRPDQLRVIRAARSMSAARVAAAVKLAVGSIRPIVYEKENGKYKATKMPYPMDGPEAARRMPRPLEDDDNEQAPGNDIYQAWLDGGARAMGCAQPPILVSVEVPPWQREGASIPPEALMALMGADGSFNCSRKKDTKELSYLFKIEMKTSHENVVVLLCAQHCIGDGRVWVYGSSHMDYYSLVRFQCSGGVLLRFFATHYKYAMARAPQCQLAIALIREAGLGGGSGNKGSVTDAKLKARNIIAHVMSAENGGKKKPQKKDDARVEYYKGLFQGFGETLFITLVAFFVFGDGTAGIYSNGKNPPRYCISVKQSDESFLEALSDCLRKHGFAKLSIGEGGLDGFADDGYDRRKAYNGSIASVEACRELAEGLLVSLRAAGLQMSRKVKALELMVANATPTQSVLDAYRAS